MMESRRNRSGGKEEVEKCRKGGGEEGWKGGGREVMERRRRRSDGKEEEEKWRKGMTVWVNIYP